MNYGEIVRRAEQEMKEKGVYEGNYLPPGTETGYTNFTNLDYFKTLAFKYRMIDTQPASTECSFFGQKLSTPVLAAALSEFSEVAPNSLVEVAKGIKEAGSMMWLGISSQQATEDVARVGAPLVKIVKPYRDMGLIETKLRQAEEVGAVAVGMDIDFFVGFKRGDTARMMDVMSPKTSEELKRFASLTRLPFILKGVLSGEDAAKAEAIGARGIVVSNHGAAVLDYSAHALEVLPEIVGTVSKDMLIFVDGGFRRGTDVLKALALGAHGVLLGRSLVRGLAAGGAEGVKQMVGVVTEELQRAMTVTGCKDLSSVDKDILIQRNYIIPWADKQV